MNMMRWTILLILFLSCGNNPGMVGSLVDTSNLTSKKIVPGLASTDPLQFRTFVAFDSIILDGPDSLLKKTLIRSFPGDLASVKSDQLLTVKQTEKGVPFGTLGPCQVYKIELSTELPQVIPKTMFLIVSRGGGKAALLPLASFRHFTLTPRDSVFLVGGTFLSRAKGFFMVYRFNGRDGFDLTFNTAKDPSCSGSIPIYNSSLDCISYDPFELNLEIADENGDGINDLIFTGKVLFYCQGLETGYGRTDRKPLKEKNIKVIFHATVGETGPVWKLQDTSVCRILSGN